MSDFKFSCPHCNQHLQANEQLSGRQIQCPNCSHLIRIPAVPGKTAQFNPQSGMTWATFVAPAQNPAPKSGPPAPEAKPPKPSPE
jgi:DNA-directed RNA polymerase subunit RPC12/RpoP